MIMLPPIVRLLRPAEWVKNILVFAPLFFTPTMFHAMQAMTVFWGVIIFCGNASSIYILNDLKDRIADLDHPLKSKRPIVSGKVSVSVALILCIILSITSLICAILLSSAFFKCLLAYYVVNIAYCYGLKRFAIIDVYCIATGFVLRVVAGSALIDVTPSIWILMCTGLLALFLGFAKRRDDVVHHLTESHRKSIRGYTLAFIDASIIVILSALFIAYMIYTTLSVTVTHLHTTHFYWTVPLVLLAILRYLQITLVEARSGSPTFILYTDPFLLTTVIAWGLLAAVLMY